jgi:DNA-binding NarL/FixJ family response regulator
LARIEASRIAIIVVSAELMECSKMSACTSPSPGDLSRVQTISRSNVENEGAFLADTASLVDLPATRQFSEKKVRVYVAAHNRLLREALVRILTKRGNVEVTGLDSPLACEAATLVRQGAEVLLLVSLGAVQEDLVTIQRLHANAPSVRILLIGSSNEDGEFLQCVRAGISGYLWRDASADHVLDGIRAVHAGEAVCPGALCTTLFRHFERETPELPRQPAPAIRMNTGRTAARPADRQRLHQQGNRQSLLSLGTNRQESLVPHEAQDRRRRSPEHRAKVPNARLSAVIPT